MGTLNTQESDAAAHLSTGAPREHHDGANLVHGRFGLRAVWGIGLFLLTVFLFVFIFHAATKVAEGKPVFPKHVASQHGPKTNLSSEDATARPAIIGDGEGFLAVALSCLLLAGLERRRFATFGIGTNRMSDFLPGAFWGLALLSALVLLLRSLHVLIFDARVLSGSAIYVSGAKWLLAFLCVGLMEEYLTRGYLQYTLTRGFFTLAERVSPAHAGAVAFWSAAAVMSILFGAGHLLNPGETAPGIAAVFLAGMVFTYALWRTGSLWWAIGFHMAWDWAQSFLYGVPDSGFLSAGRLFNTHPTGSLLLSGGKTGPEASIFVLPTLLLVLVVVRFTTRPGAQPALDPLPAANNLAQGADAVIA